MKQKEIIGIRRANQFSPNHVGNDGAIFDLTSIRLKELGYRVTVCSETEFLELPVPVGTAVFNMARSKTVILKLQQLEDAGSVVINSGYGIENCSRERMTRLLIDSNVPHPDSLIVETSDPDVVARLQALHFENSWVKRGDFHAIHKEDVSYVRHSEEAGGILSEYALRGIRRAVVNRHLEGDLIKFYGVSGSDFFYWFYPFDSNHSKFGWERINGKASGISFSEEEMRHICQRASEVLSVSVYGGDCIVSPDGSIRIIDFNDWPSFAPCRDRAAPCIGDCIDRVISHARVIQQQCV